MVSFMVPGDSSMTHDSECLVPPSCPTECVCTDGIVDCRDQGLTIIPPNLPTSATEM